MQRKTTHVLRELVHTQHNQQSCIDVRARSREPQGQPWQAHTHAHAHTTQ